MKKVYLSPSVQEKNIGFGDYGSEEYRMNLIADEVETYLKGYDVIVYRNDPRQTLDGVVSHSNSLKPDIHVSIHSNAGGGKGCEVFCYKFNTVGHNLAKLMYDRLEPLTPSTDRGVKQGFEFYGKGKHIYEVAYTTCPACLIEVDFHDTRDGSEFITKNIRNIGECIGRGIVEFLGLKAISLTPTLENENYKVKYEKLHSEVIKFYIDFIKNHGGEM